MNHYRQWGKRTFDLVVGLTVMLSLSIVIIGTALAVWLKLGRPVMFTQIRAGKNGRAFQMFKFRTMTGQKDAQGQLLPDDQRLTEFGRFLRSTSLDELPELLNVIRGEMSLVGPRPLLVEYLQLYTQEQSRRHDVRPGITGWAQVNGRNAISWEQKFAHDVWYADRCRLGLDLWILAQTVMKVLQRGGISAQGDATMPAFRGSPTDPDKQ